METIDKAVDERLDAQRTALVVIDLQEGIVNARELAPHPAGQVIGNAALLAERFTELGAFVVLVRVSSADGKDVLHPHTDVQLKRVQPPQGWDVLVPELAKVEHTHVITKHQWGAFYGTDLDLQLRRRGINTIVLCGVSTAIGVDTTAREAFQHGYQQIFVEDAMSASTAEEHAYVCRTIFPKIGKVRSAAQVAAALGRAE